jgi:hypothetical protein
MKKGAKHFDDGKPEIQFLLEMDGLEDVAACGTYGFKKYGDRYNYRSGMSWTKLLGSCARHLRAFIMGEDNDFDYKCSNCKKNVFHKEHSGLPHLAHLIYDALMLMHHVKHHKNLDDRYYSLKR